MLPADLVGSGLEQLPVFEDYEGTDPAVRSIVVSYSTNILVTVLTALVCFRFLRQLGFATGQAVAGVLALLFCTTHLHYTQNMMENNYIMLLTLTGLSFQYDWLRTGSRRALLIGSAAFGLNLLTRLTTGLDLMAGGLFLLLVLWFEKAGGREFWQRLVTYVKTAAPVYLVFVLIDRLYQYYRFGSILNTYVSVFAQEYKRLNPNLPAKYPWETPFHVGFLGALFKPEKSIFLFDPLLLLTILIGVLAWRVTRGREGIPHHGTSCCCSPTSASMRATPYGAAISRGETVTSRPPWNSWRSSPCRCCCAIGRSSGSAYGELEFF